MSRPRIKQCDVKDIKVFQKHLTVVLKDDKEMSILFNEFPRLRKASLDELRSFSVDDYGLRWETLDEDISFDSVFFPADFPLTATR